MDIKINWSRVMRLLLPLLILALAACWFLVFSTARAQVLGDGGLEGAFVNVHIFAVVVAGLVNELRASAKWLDGKLIVWLAVIVVSLVATAIGLLLQFVQLGDFMAYIRWSIQAALEAIMIVSTGRAILKPALDEARENGN